MPYVNNINPSANVYLKEIDLTQRVQGLSTSIGAVVGHSSRGPVGVPTLITTNQEFMDTFGKPHPSQGWLHYSALAFLKESSQLYVVRVDTNALTAGAYCTVDDPEAITPTISLDAFNDTNGYPLGRYDPINNVGFIESDPGVNHVLFYVCAQNPGTWNNNLFIRVTPSASIGYNPGDIDDPTIFKVEVFENFTGPNDYPLESFIVCREVKIDGYGNPLFIEDVINRRSNLIRVKNNPFSNQAIPIKTSSFVFLSGGDNGNTYTTSDIVNGWNLFSDVESTDVGILINAGYAVPAVHNKMDEIATKRMDSIAILDMPSLDQQTSDAINYRQMTLNLHSSYSAIFTPDVKIYDRYNDMSLFVPPSGYVAAAMAKTDRTDYVWYATAGVRRGNLFVDELKFLYNINQRDALNDAHINMIRRLPSGNFAIWNNATLFNIPSAQQHISVRRLMNYIEKSISKSLVPSLFDPNDHRLRKDLVGRIEAFLEPIKQGDGFGDYKVVCDEVNNPAYITANGDLVIDMAVDPEARLAAKRILLRAIVNKTGARVTSLN